MVLRHDDETRCSDLRLDRYLSGELDTAARLRFEAHLADSAPCRSRCEELSEDRRRFLERPAIGAWRDGVAIAPPRPTRRYALAVTLAAAASLGLVLWPAGEASSERTKGPAFVVHAAHEGVVTELVDGALVRAGDRLRFSFPGDAGRWVAVIGRDGSGRTAPYLPAEGDAVRLDDPARPIDGAVIIDAVFGDERLFAFACDRATPVARLAAAVKESGTDAPPSVEGCTVHRLTLAKDTGPMNAR
jgi:hypothetical protein